MKNRPLRRLAVISDRHRFVWVQVPKAASTTLHALTAAWREADEAAGGEEIRRRPDSRRLQDAGLRSEILDTQGLARLVQSRPDHYYYCFVRDPYARLVSAYKNKLNRYARAFRSGDYCLSKIYQHLTGWPTREATTRGLRFLQGRISFEELVEGLHRHGIAFDDHFSEQVEILQPDLVPYRRIGKVESFQQDIEIIQSELGLAPAGAQGPPRLNASRGGNRSQDYFSPRSSEIARDIYRRDFERLGYAA